jgi:hypothetical protein
MVEKRPSMRETPKERNVVRVAASVLACLIVSFPLWYEDKKYRSQHVAVRQGDRGQCLKRIEGDDRV